MLYAIFKVPNSWLLYLEQVVVMCYLNIQSILNRLFVKITSVLTDNQLLQRKYEVVVVYAPCYVLE